jgi:cation-transporting ATPase 13A2
MVSRVYTMGGRLEYMLIPNPYFRFAETTHAIFDGPAAYSVPKSLASIHFMDRARRSSISSNRRSDYGRPSFDFRRSQDGGMRSRSNTGHYSNYSEDYNHRPDISRHVSGRSGRSYRTEQSQAVDDQDWAEPPDMEDVRDHEEALRSPGILPRIASVFGFGRLDDHADEGLGRRRSRSIGSRGGRSRRSSHVSSRSRGESADASQYMSDGTESWGYTSNEDDMDTSSLISDRGEGGDEGYSSSLADDTSLPPNSRPSSPPMPLLPSDGIFGDPHPEQQNSLVSEPFAGPDTNYRQTILLPDEDLKIRFTGYVTAAFKSVLWFFGCVFTFGILGLVGRWVPSVWIRWVGKPTDFNEKKDGAWAVVEV